jgi:hypothetical protein
LSKYRANVGIATAYLWLLASYLQFRKNMNCNGSVTVWKFLSIGLTQNNNKYFSDMNWVIYKSQQMKIHTYLDEVLAPILDDIKEYNWLIADVKFHSTLEGKLPIDMEQEYFILSSAEFDILLKAKVQIWWGIILGIPKTIDININEINLPFAEGNALIWKDGKIQHPDAEIEIIAFDSSYTIVKFKDGVLSNKFRDYFPEATDLKSFK